MATLPVTMCTSERSFSTLRHLKTYLRNTDTNKQLNGLVLLNIHRDIKLDTNYGFVHHTSSIAISLVLKFNYQ